MKTITQFSCKECGESFTELSNLKTHETSHTEQVTTRDKIDKKISSRHSFATSAILAILALITIAQTVQAQIIFNKFSRNGYAANSPDQTQTNAPLPSSLQNLPNMVGGC